MCTVPNATAALSIVTRLLFGSEGDRKNVLVPSFTFAAGPEALVTHGYTPVFLDINTELQPSIQQAREYLEAVSYTHLNLSFDDTHSMRMVAYRFRAYNFIISSSNGKYGGFFKADSQWEFLDDKDKTN